MEYAILQCDSLAKEGVSVFFLCKSSFPKERLSSAVEIIEFESVDSPETAFAKLRTIWRMTVGLNRYSQQIRRIAEDGNFKFILFAFYKEYFSPFWIGPIKQLKINGCAMGTIAHDPVRDFVIGPKWWHRFCVRKAFSFLTHVFVHDDTPVDFGGRQPEGIQVHQIPHWPYEVAEPKIGRLEMRKRLGFSLDLTTENTDEHGYQKTQQGDAQGICAGASEPNSLASELADSPASESLTRSASGPAVVRIAPVGMGSAGGNQLADSKEFLEGQSQAGLQMGLQKLPPPRAAMGSGTSGDNSSSVLIREIRGQNSSSSETSHSALDSSLAATAAGRPLRFAIQWVEDFRDDEGHLVSINPWLREHPQVEVIGQYFEGDEYERRLAQTHVMVLPYRMPYQLRVSRVVIEAILNGMPVIATEGTTLHEQAGEYGVVVGCEEGDAESLAEAMLEVSARFESLWVNAEEKASAAAESFSVSCFKKSML